MSALTEKQAIDLGRRAVACKVFMWMPGMLTTGGSITLAVNESGEPTVVGHAEYELGDVSPFVDYDCDFTKDHFTPDFRDPATLGCGRDILERVWGPDYIIQFGGWCDIVIYFREEAEQAWIHGDEAEQIWDSDNALIPPGNPAAALIAALEAAP